MKRPLIVLTGPTAVGKTSLSISLAKAEHGEIISADSMQVYKRMDIGSAKIRKEEMQGVEHYLVDVLAGLTDEQVQTMLNCEFGGMNEALAQVYALTGDKKYLDASYRFYHRRLMEPLAEGKDILPGLHSNTQIPKIIGSARQYELTGNPKDERIA